MPRSPQSLTATTRSPAPAYAHPPTDTGGDGLPPRRPTFRWKRTQGLSTSTSSSGNILVWTVYRGSVNTLERNFITEMDIYMRVHVCNVPFTNTLHLYFPKPQPEGLRQ